MSSMQLLNIDASNKLEVIKVNPYFRDLNENIISEIITGMCLFSMERYEIVSWEGEDCAGLPYIQNGSEIQGITTMKKRELHAAAPVLFLYLNSQLLPVWITSRVPAAWTALNSAWRARFVAAAKIRSASSGLWKPMLFSAAIKSQRN